MYGKIAKFFEKIFKNIQKYCSLIIPNDERGNECLIILRSRIIILITIIVIFVLIGRIFFLLFCDVYKHKIYNTNKITQFKRLNITDRNGEVLASNIEVYDFYLQSSKISDIITNIRKINSVIPGAIKDEEVMFEKLKSKQSSGKKVFIKSGITVKQRQQLLDKDIDGMFFETREKRFYSNSSANSITGYCPSIYNCISGIEKSMNSYLITDSNEPLKLSINIKVQNILHEILSKRIKETISQGAVGIIMKISTGEIISAVSLPDCDFNDYSNCSPNALFNKYSYGVYELGSVMKLITVGLALQNGISPYKQYKRKSYKIDNRFTIHDVDKKESAGGTLNLIEMTKKSSNVGFAKLMEDIDVQKQIDFISNLGLLQKLQTELPELGKPQYPKNWSFINSITIAYGHGLAITPLHYVTAIASLLKNSIVRPTFISINESDHEDRYDYKYLDKNSHKMLKYIMREVITSGGGKSAYVKQYDIGGKTGTAIQLENGVYNRYSMVLSFVAALPMENPQYVFLLMLEKPKTNAQNNSINRASTLLGKTMNYVISTIGPMLNIKPIQYKDEK